MKKNKFKKYLKLGIFLLGISLLLVNCELKDENLGLSDSNIQVSHVSFKDLKEKKQLSGLFNKIETRFNKTPKIYGKNVYATDSTFYISTDFIYKTVKDSITNYSFKIVRPNIESTSIENLVVSKNNNTNALTLFIFEFYDANTGINSRYYQITDEELANNLFGKTIYIYGNPVEVQDCLNVSYEPCSGDGNADGHAATSNCGGSATILDSLDCFVASGGGGGGTGGYTGAGGYNGGGYNGGSTNTSTNYNAPNGAIAINDALVGDGETPCEQLKKTTMDSIFKAKLQTLKTNVNNATATNMNFETGYTQTPADANLSSYNYEYFEESDKPNSEILTLTYPTINNGLISCFMHTHYSLKLYSVFSLDDIKEIYDMKITHHIYDDNTFTAVLITKHGTTYALKFDDPQKLVNFGNHWFDQFWDINPDLIPEFIENKSGEIRKKFKKKIKVKQSVELNEKNFAKFLKKMNIGMSLYKSNANFTQWSKVETNGDLTPCN